MTDMPEWRAWADCAHADSIRPRRPSKALYRCTNCKGRTTRNQAKASGGDCIYCRAPLRAKAEFAA